MAMATPKQRRVAPPSFDAPTSSTSVDIPYQHEARMQSEDGSPFHNHDFDDNEDHWEHDSPTSSLTKLASSLAQRVEAGSLTPPNPFLVHNLAVSNALPSAAQLEADAIREREKSRRDAERILTQEAEERRKVEERIRGLLNSDRKIAPASPRNTRAMSLPAPPSPLSMGPALSSSPKGEPSLATPSWWTAAKARLTPTKDKEPLTPAQQIAQEAKAREKEERKAKKAKSKEEPVREFLNLNAAHFNRAPPDGYYTPGTSPILQPTPTSPNRLPAPARDEAVYTPNASPRSSHSQKPNPQHTNSETGLYISRHPDGDLDMSTTLLTIAKRFEKLERWTVGHVRALEERMSDVERWLVEKEEERERESEKKGWREDGSIISGRSEKTDENISGEVSVIRDELDELRQRVGILGREVAKLSASASSKASSPVPQPQQAALAPMTPLPTPQPPSQPIQIPGRPNLSPSPHQHSDSIVSPPAENVSPSNSPPPAETTSPSASRAKFPYPSGDFTEPEPNPSPNQTLSRSNSVTSNSAKIGIITGLPRSLSPALSAGSSSSGLPNSHLNGSDDHSPIPSPTPRKRYTVALGKPITAARSLVSETSPTSEKFGAQLERAFSSETMELNLNLDIKAKDSKVHKDEVFVDDGETIGKTKGLFISSAYQTEPLKQEPVSPIPPTRSRPRPQSSYGPLPAPFAGSQSVDTNNTAPLRTKNRSKSIDRIGAERQKEREREKGGNLKMSTAPGPFKAMYYEYVVYGCVTITLALDIFTNSIRHLMRSLP